MNRRSELEAATGPVSRETFERLEAYEGLFRRWNARINLASSSTLNDFWRRHVIDSAQLWPMSHAPTRWMDLGSGGGLPGIVIAILGAPSDLRCTLIESNHKKAAFLRSCAVELGLDVDVQVKRIESASLAERPEIVSARALASLSNLLRLSLPWINPSSGRALFHKGRDYQQEIDDARDEWHFDLVEHVSIVDTMSRVLEISNVRRLER